MADKPDPWVERLQTWFGQLGVNLRRLVSYKLAVEETKYKTDQNPLHAWGGYQLARAAGEAPPEWVLEYFDRCAAALVALEDAPPAKNNLPAAVTKSLEMNGGGRGGSVFSRMAEWKKTTHWTSLSLQVLEKISEGDQPDHAIQAVADFNGVHYSTVHRAFKKAQAEFPDDVRSLSEKH